MSKVIQTKLQTLKFDRKKSQNFSKIQLHNTPTNKKSSLDLQRSGNKPSFFSSSSYSSSFSDDNDLPISADRRYKKETRTSKYHTYSEGSFKHLDEIRSNQFQLVTPASSPEITNIIEEEKFQKEKNSENAELFQNNKNRKREEGAISSKTAEETGNNDSQRSKKFTDQSIPTIIISPDDGSFTQDDNTTDYNDDEYDDDDDNFSGDTSDSLLYYSSEEEDDDDDQVIQYNHLNPPQIHIAVRRDASLFKIEKISRENMTPAFNLAEVPKISNLTQKAEIDENQDWVFSIPKQNNNQVLTTASAGIMTPPESPECQYNKLGGDSTESATYEMDNELCFIHVQKRAHRSIKSFITGTYQLNYLTVTKVSSSVSPYPGLHCAIDNTTRKSKLLLKIIIVSLNDGASEEQRRFGFTFRWHKSVSSRNQEQRFKLQDDAKFAIAPDSLVKESLVTWIGSQNQAQGEGMQLPSLPKADSIMRDGKKIYVVYDPSLFLV
ncbi:hypothetical protein K501DRAFT_266240 [Backusella circina FSU 941]|nr:hypothetical protein K501DRAFT_266240 [Backusella circina FSU 941]